MPGNDPKGQEFIGCDCRSHSLASGGSRSIEPASVQISTFLHARRHRDDCQCFECPETSVFGPNHSEHTSTNRIKQLRAKDEVVGQVVRAGAAVHNPVRVADRAEVAKRSLCNRRHTIDTRTRHDTNRGSVVGSRRQASRCPVKGATYVGNGGCGPFYSLSVTNVLIPIASRISWSRAIPTVW